jgi:hypothetical protein
MPFYKQAVEAMCKSCIYDALEPGTWREQVQDCLCTDCPLYELRPVPIQVQRSKSKKGNQDTRQLLLRTRVNPQDYHPEIH